MRPLLGGLGLKSWGYDALNPLKEMPCSDRRFMAITKLELMGFLILLEIIQVPCVFFGFLSNVSKVMKTFNMFGHRGYLQIFMLTRLGAAR